MLFIVTKIADVVTLVERNLGRGKPATIKVDFVEFVKDYAAFRGEAPEVLAEAVVDLRSPNDYEFCTMERARATVYLAVHEYERNVQKKAHAELLQYQVKPTACYAQKHIKAGELKVVPSVDLSRFMCVKEEEVHKRMYALCEV